MISKPTIEELSAIDLSPLYPLLTSKEENYLAREAGVEHYKLLGWLSKQFSGVTLTEVGTLSGMGLIALSLNPENKVVSWDIRDFQWKNKVPTNGERKIVKDGYMDEVMKTPFIFYDAQHEGQEEREFLQELLDKDYHGVVVWDDIHLNAEMKSFWKEVIDAGLNAQDWTDIGHSCGTGIVFL